MFKDLYYQVVLYYTYKRALKIMAKLNPEKGAKLVTKT